MKKAQATWVVIAFILVSSFILHSQETETSIQVEPLSLTPADVAAFPTLSEAQAAALVSALDATPTIPVEQGTLGTFYSLQHPEWPPLPADLSGSSVWSFGTFCLLSDLNYNYQAAAGVSLMKLGGRQAMTLDIPSPEDGGDTNGYGTYESSYTPVDYGTNLWLIITNVAGSVADLVLSNTLPDVPYEIQANADIAQTNWIFAGWVYGSEETNWTPVSVVATNDPALFYRVRSWADDGSGLPIWWQEQYFGTTGVDPYGDPDGDGWNNLQEFQNGTDPTLFNTPPTPQGLTVNYNANNGTAKISWLQSSGPVTNYTITDSDGNTFNVSASTTTYTADVSAYEPDPWSHGTIPITYTVKANYAGGSSTVSAAVPLEAASFAGSISAGVQGAPVLTIKAMPANTTGIRLTEIDETALGAESGTIFVTNFTVSISNFTNGSFMLPNIAAPDDDNYFWVGQAVGADGSLSATYPLVGDYNNYSDMLGNSMTAPFYDGRVQLKQNLIFLLRSGLEIPLMAYGIDANNNTLDAVYVAPTNGYAQAGFYDYSGSSYFPQRVFDQFLPFEQNYFYRNFVFNLLDTDPNGLLASLDTEFTTRHTTMEDFIVVGLKITPPFVFEPPSASGGSIASVLTTNETQWLFMSVPNFVDSEWNSPIGLIQSEGTNYLAANFDNRFGLQFLSTKIAWGNNSSETFVLNSGAGTTENGWYYSETAQPQFSTAEYDFFSPNGSWDETTQTPIDPTMPGVPAFSPTNQSQLFVVTPFSSVQIAGYAKLAVTNGNPGVFAYLGQYFDQAYKITNGIVTTNTTGVLSPYGNFFATDPGPAALVTMPDIDTGERGTATVYTVSAVLERTQGSNMDLSFNGANATSIANPATFWANNNYDRGHAVDGSDFEQDDLSLAQVANLNVPAEQQVPDCQYKTNGYPAIPCTRDLEDYFRFWTPGVAALMKVLPNNYTVQLTLSGDGAIRIFQAVEPDGGTNYLFDATTASNQVANSTSLYIGTLTASTPIVFNIQTNFNEHFLFCGAQTGSAQVDLQILDNNLNVLADSPVYLQIKDIKQMYERWTVGENPNVPPMSAATWQVDNLAFQYTPPQDTNTPYILFVHGWNQETWEKDRYAEAAYKRLYWQGYQGRFGFYRWPTGNGISDTLDAVFHARNYDNSEYQAWQSATGLTNLLTQLNAQYPGNVYLMAHSMGNVVASEALNKANTQLVNTYIAMQGAVPAHCYDPNTTTRVIVPYLGLGYDDGTPNRYAQYYTDGSPSYFSSSAGARKYVNFFNTNDYALSATLWQFNQNLKPDNATTPGYHYSSSSGFYKVIGAQTNSITYLSFPQDTYEIFAYCDEPRCYALGAQPDVGGVFKPGATYQQVDLTQPPYNFGQEHKFHSGEFRSDNQQRWQFWSQVLNQMGLQ